jgi:DNA mismatch repair protein MutS2
VLYPKEIEQKLGFDVLRNRLAEKCLCPQGQELVHSMSFMSEMESIVHEHDCTFEFLKIIQNQHDFPTENYFDLRPVFARIRPQGTFPVPEEVFDLKMSLKTLKSISLFFKPDERQNQYPRLAETAEKLKLYPYVHDLCDKIVGRNATVRDNASPELARIRRTIAEKQQQVSKAVSQIFKSAQHSGWVDPDLQPVIRDGRLMIPVLAPFKRQVRGIVHDESTTGKTVFIEPAEAVEINNAIREEMAEEKREIRRILIAFADEIRPYIPDLIEAYNILGIFDFTRAKALLALSLKATKIGIVANPFIDLRMAINPILQLNFVAEKKSVVPLEVKLTHEERILLISGPNAGGKSVALKTVGILQYMMQCGMLVPACESSTLGIFRNMFINIGDDQSMDNDLSTYSSHLLHMKNTLRDCNRDSLVLIDEFGSGTEPVIGGAIAEAILDKLNQKQVFGVITTHYSNLKHYASQTPGIINGAMMFDTARIEPTFKLEQGKPGGSFAIEIAHKIGLPTDVIDDAKKRAGEDTANFDKHLREILRDKKYWEDKRDQIRKQEKRLEEVIQKQLTFLEEAKKTKSEIKQKTRDEAEKLLADVNKRIENAIREIKESQADKGRTSLVRKELEQLRHDIKHGKKSDKDEVEQRIEVVSKIARKHGVAKPENEGDTEPKPLEKGDHVRIQGQDSIGQIIEISEKTAAVAFGDFITTVAPSKLEFISRNQARKQIRASRPTHMTNEFSKKRLTFKPYIDVRGKYADEAIQIIGEFVDNAIMFESHELRILHGRGNGILRQVIRDYLRSIRQVSDIADEHIDHGGDGITVVKLD